MTANNKSQTFYMFLSLLALMVITRGKHFPSSIYLPDATIAIFFVGGIYLRKQAYSVAFLLAAWLVDDLAFLNGVSSSCVTPAYIFLIPTYLVMWYGGTKFNNLDIDSIRSGLSFACVLFICTGLAFMISSGSFYLLSGYFKELSLSGFTPRINKYFPWYVGSTFMYMAILVTAYKCKMLLSHALGRFEYASK